jgi:periplasmic divalent cation tolerance protein
MTNLPDRDTATRLAEALVDNRTAACVNILAPCRSIYHWKGRTESAEEIPMLIKTTSERYDAVERSIRELHPYELPEIICVQVSAGLPAYLQWIQEETR